MEGDLATSCNRAISIKTAVIGYAILFAETGKCRLHCGGSECVVKALKDWLRVANRRRQRILRCGIPSH